MDLFAAIFDDHRHDKAAICYRDQVISYAQLRELTLAIADQLYDLNVEAGERVGILLYDSPEFVASFIASCSMGAIAVPINMALSVNEQSVILADCGARIAIVEADLCRSITEGAGENLRELRELILAGEENGGASTPPIESASPIKMQRLKQTRRYKDSPVNLPHAIPTDTPAFILYTSGSTGDPKGAVHTVEHLFQTNATYCKEVLRLRDGDRLFSSSRLPFAYGLGNSFTFPLLNGFTSVLCREKPSPAVIAETLKFHRPTIFFGVPVVYSLLLEYHRTVANLDCSSLRLCISAGEALPAHLGEDWQSTFGVEVLDGIGSTEMLHMWMSNHEGQVRYGSSGKLLSGYQARLLDQTNNPVQTGAEGNLWVKGPSAALGYWGKPDITARTFVDGWVRTGDLYRSDADGYWFHMGRSDDCFKSSGQWVSPVEVEGVLLRHAIVARTAVVEDFDEHGLSCPCAFIVKQSLESDERSLEQELREQCRLMLPRFKQPRRYHFVSELPYTATGKIQRFKLRETLRAKSHEGTGIGRPESQGTVS